MPRKRFYDPRFYKGDDVVYNEFYTPGGYHPYYGYFEQVEPSLTLRNGGFVFLEDNEKPVYIEYIDFDTENINVINRYFPLREVPWPLAAEAIPYEDFEEELWYPVTRYIYEHVDLPDELLYPVLTAWVHATWVTEIWRAVPYLFFFGIKDTGKTRALETLHQLCYRSILTPSTSGAALYRAEKRYRPTFLFDESEIYSQEGKAEVIGLLNAGYRRGQYAIRSVKRENGEFDLELFDVFGFKALAGTKTFKSTLVSRSIVVEMERMTREVNFMLDEKTSRELRGKLLYFRLRTLNALKLSERTDSTDRTDNPLKKIPEELKFTNGRTAELFYPLWKIAPEHDRELIVEYIKKAHRRREREEEVSVEAEILAKIIELEDSLDKGRFSLKDLTDKFNEGRSEKEKWTSRAISRIVRKLHFEPDRLRDGSRGFIWDRERIKRLAQRYNIAFPEESSVQSVPSVLSANTVCAYCGYHIGPAEPYTFIDGKPVHVKCAGLQPRICNCEVKG